MTQEFRLPHGRSSTDPKAEQDIQTKEIGHGGNERTDPRREMDTQAFVSMASVPTRAYAIREISRGGMFLGFRDSCSTRQELEQNGIDRDTPLDIAFVVTTGDKKERFNVRARISRITRRGIGVAFVTHNPPQLAALREFFSRSAEGQPD
jgi:hypothetical protein